VVVLNIVIVFVVVVVFVVVIQLSLSQFLVAGRRHHLCPVWSSSYLHRAAHQSLAAASTGRPRPTSSNRATSSQLRRDRSALDAAIRRRGGRQPSHDEDPHVHERRFLRLLVADDDDNNSNDDNDEIDDYD